MPLKFVQPLPPFRKKTGVFLFLDQIKPVISLPFSQHPFIFFPKADRKKREEETEILYFILVQGFTIPLLLREILFFCDDGCNWEDEWKESERPVIFPCYCIAFFLLVYKFLLTSSKDHPVG